MACMKKSNMLPPSLMLLASDYKAELANADDMAAALLTNVVQAQADIVIGEAPIGGGSKSLHTSASTSETQGCREARMQGGKGYRQDRQTDTLTHSHTHAHTHTLTHSLTHTHTHSLTHSLTHSHTHSHTHPLCPHPRHAFCFSGLRLAQATFLTCTRVATH